ncbi:MAG TPA: transporter substrate-binding domain-containing protein [Streptosporangiaceae bacterium]|nr:transporter substrate-binding domain-containing protein [Streptosporangiaceae bacterium]
MRRVPTKTTLAVVGLLAFLNGCGSSSAGDPSIFDGPGPVVVGVANDAPGFSVGDHNPAGFDIDLMNAIGRGLHKPVTTHLIASKDRDPALKNNQVTIVVDQYSITLARNAAGIDFAGPYMVSTQALLLRRDDRRITTKGDAKGKSVCAEEDTTGASAHLPGALFTKLPTLKECVDALLRKNADAVLTDTLLLYGYVATDPERLKVVLPGDVGQTQYYGIGLLGGHRQDCRKLNQIIRDYLRTQWRRDFQDTLPVAVKAFPGSDPGDGDFESEFKPLDTDMTRLSCKLAKPVTEQPPLS